MRFLVDNQLPVSLTRFFGERGIECQHVLEVGLAQVPDREIWRYASLTRMIVISKDEDFLHLALRPGAATQVVWVRLGNCRARALFAVFEKAWPRIQACLEAGDRVVEIR